MKSVAKDTPWRSWRERLRGTGKGRVHDRRVDGRRSGLLIENGSAPCIRAAEHVAVTRSLQKYRRPRPEGVGLPRIGVDRLHGRGGWHSPLLTRTLLPTFLATIRCSLEMFVAPEPGAWRRRSTLALDRALGSYNAADGLIVTTLGFVGAAADICSGLLAGATGNRGIGGCGGCECTRPIRPGGQPAPCRQDGRINGNSR